MKRRLSRFDVRKLVAQMRQIRVESFTRKGIHDLRKAQREIEHACRPGGFNRRPELPD